MSIISTQLNSINTQQNNLTQTALDINNNDFQAKEIITQGISSPSDVTKLGALATDTTNLSAKYQNIVGTAISNGPIVTNAVQDVSTTNVQNALNQANGIIPDTSQISVANSAALSGLGVNTNTISTLQGANGNLNDTQTAANSLGIDNSFLNNQASGSIPSALPSSSSSIVDLGYSSPNVSSPDVPIPFAPTSSAADTTSQNQASTIPNIDNQTVAYDNFGGISASADEANKGNGSSSAGEIFYGLNLMGGNTQVATQALLNWQSKLYNGQGNNLTTQIYAPWDLRLAGTYANTQSIGNQMPYGPEWVGSPSLMNKLALIRFDNVASTSHHKYLLDRANSQSIRFSTAQVSYLNFSKIADIAGADSNGVISPLSLSALQNNSEYKSSFQDSISASVDPSTGTVTSTNVLKNTVVYKNNKGEELDITVDSQDQGCVNTQLGNGNLAVTSTNADIPTTCLKHTPTPDQLSYWYAQSGLVECPVGSGSYIASEFCIDGKPGVPSGTTADQLNQMTAQLEASKANFKTIQANAAIKIAEGWTYHGFKIETNPVMQNQLPSDPNKNSNLVETEPTTDNLCNANNWVGNEQFLYDWTDFLYCKYYGLIPNNYLITLRRFPVPIVDNGKIPGQDNSGKFITPIVKAVSWCGEDTGNDISTLLSFQTGFNWENVEADAQLVQGNEQSMDGMMGDNKIGKGIEKLFESAHTVSDLKNPNAGFNRRAGWDEGRAKFDPYDGGPYANRVYGPINVINSTLVRKRGLKFEHTIKVKFTYSAKSIGGINAKAALLDILANMLAMTSSNAAFWGGAVRYFPNKPAHPMPGGKAGAEKYLSGDVTGFMDTGVKEITGALGSITDTLFNIFKVPIGTIKALAQGGSKLALGNIIGKAQKRPEILKIKALLTGEPIGEWHLMIGNPFNPMLSVGNLVVDTAEYSVSKQLGPDDFPDELNIEVTLKHGKPRDKGDIESMFNRGGGRLHYAYYGTNQEAWNASSASRNSTIDRPASTKDIDVNGGGPFTGNLMFSGVGGYSYSKTNQSNTSLSKTYSSISSQAIELAQRMGFKSGAQANQSTNQSTTSTIP